MDWQFWIEKLGWIFWIETLVVGTAWLVVGIVVAIVFGHLVKEKDDVNPDKKDR